MQLQELLMLRNEDINTGYTLGYVEIVNVVRE